MNLDDLTIGQARALAAMFPAANPANAAAPHPFVGKFVICRCASAGVHAGVLVSQAGDSAILSGARRLWSWKAVSGVALSGVAVSGLAPGCKVDTELPEIALTGVIETIPTSEAARRSIHGA